MKPARFRWFVWAGLVVAAVAGCGKDEGPEQNTTPTACFTLTPPEVSTGTSFQVDARCSSDDQDAAGSLQVRWDWENDGIWDTGYSATKTSAHRYAAPGTRTVRLEVKDTEGLLDTETHTVSVTTVGGFVLVQPGRFTMGSPTDELCRLPCEMLHWVTLTHAFYVSTTEVTQAQWRAVMGWNESYFDGFNLPVERITWFDAVKYCNQRSTREGLTPAYMISDASYDGNHITGATVTWNPSADGYRLLTEAEWEYTCRAGSTTAFSYGEISGCDSESDPNLDPVGWYAGNSGRQTHVVEIKGPNAWGIHDMHGNVWEWCWDWYGDYEGSWTDPVGPSSGLSRVKRGGSWQIDVPHCRSAARAYDGPEVLNYDLGLRLARTAY